MADEPGFAEIIKTMIWEAPNIRMVANRLEELDHSDNVRTAEIAMLKRRIGKLEDALYHLIGLYIRDDLSMAELHRRFEAWRK